MRTDRNDDGRPARRWENPLTDGWEFRWDVLVALDGHPPETVDAVLASIDAASSNTVVQVPAGARRPGTPRSVNLVYAESVPVPDLVADMDVAVVSGSVLAALAAVRSGVPVVVLPVGPSGHETGRALAAAGAGVVVARAGEVGDAVRRIVADRALTAGVRDLAKRLAVVDVLLAMLAEPQLPLARRTRGG